MKYYILLTCTLFMLCAKCIAQDEIKFTPVFVSSDVDAAPGTINVLKNKFKSHVNSSVNYAQESSRFLLVINPNKLDVHITNNQQVIKYNMQFELHDLLADQTFHSFSITLGGIGNTEPQAFATAVSRLNLNTPLFKEEMAVGIKKISAYYARNCERILHKAELLKDAQQFQEAFAQLYLLPHVEETSCTNRYNQVFAQLWKSYNTYHCENLLNQANLLWASNPTKEGAYEVATFLQGTNLNGRCQSGFQQLVETIRNKLVNDEFDEREFRKMLTSGLIEIEKNKIQAIGEITSAYFNSLVSDNYIIVN